MGRYIGENLQPGEKVLYSINSYRVVLDCTASPAALHSTAHARFRRRTIETIPIIAAPPAFRNSITA